MTLITVSLEMQTKQHKTTVFIFSINMQIPNITTNTVTKNFEVSLSSELNLSRYTKAVFFLYKRILICTSKHLIWVFQNSQFHI